MIPGKPTDSSDDDEDGNSLSLQYSSMGVRNKFALGHSPNGMYYNA